MIIIPLTETSSGKTYKLMIPKFKTLNGIPSDSIKNNNVKFIDGLNSLITNTLLQLDTYDNENSEVTEYINYYKTSSNKQIYLQYNSFADGHVLIKIGVYTNSLQAPFFNIYSYDRYGKKQGIRIDGQIYGSKVLGNGLAYCTDNNKIYTISGNTAYINIGKTTAPNGTSVDTYQLFSDNQTSPPSVNKTVLNTKLCLYNKQSYNSNNFYLNSSFTTWFNNLNNSDYSDQKYPDNDDDPESPDYDPTDPTPGAGDGTSDPIPIPPKPTVDVTGTGFVTLYSPSAIEIRDLAYFMWSGDFTDLIKKMFSAPFDCLIGLKLIYAPLTTGDSQSIWLGNVESGVSAPKITEQFTDFDCGSIILNGYFGSFLDYSPYTKITIFLPFIGYKQLNVDEVMNSQIHLVYRIDAYSGACIAFLHITKTIGSTQLSSVIYEFDGNCAMDIPFTSGDMTRYVAAILGTAASTAGAVVSMGSGIKLGSQTVASSGTLDPFSKEDKFQKPTVTGLSDLGNGSAELIAGKPQIQRGGSLAGANASMAIKQPYLIIERPMQQMPADYANFIGIPLNMTKTLSQMSGFTVVSQIFMASSQATDEELNMIDMLLRQGVIL